MAEKTWLEVNAGLMEYGAAMELQTRLVAARIDGRLAMDVVLWLEHPSVFTLGLRGGGENLLVPEEFLKRRGIPLVRTRRGGNITYHGPGQLVAYPIIDLAAGRLRVADYVHRLEAVMLGTCSAFGVAASRNLINRGVWAGDRKLGSIGVAIRRGVSFHGMALNVHPDLTPFEWIHPCGLARTRMTSLAVEARREVTMEEARGRAREQMAAVFQRMPVVVAPDDLKTLIPAARENP
ncbi:MAG: lipoyl(octanoyl) transferase LipB [Thermodesulfobacteriota bacterium]